MSQFFVIHPITPQSRLIKQAVKIIQDGGVVAFPTDTSYAIGCQLENKKASDHIRQLRQLEESHNFTLICRDLSELSTYAFVDNTAFRLLKAHTPGPYTFILKGSKEVPKRLMHPKRKTIGLRIPDNKILQAILAELAAPLMSVTLILPDDNEPFVDAQDIYEKLGNDMDLVIDGGPGGREPTTIVDLIEGTPKIMRVGKGDVSVFE